MLKKLFFVFLGIGFLGSILQKDVNFSAYENRILQKFPDFHLESAFRGDFTSDMDLYLSDQFLLRTSWVRLKTMSDKDLFGKLCLNDVYLGKENYLINRYTSLDLDPTQIDRNLKYLSTFQERYAAEVILIPTASEILTDKLPSAYSHISQRELLSSAPVTLDSYTILDAHKQEDIYFRTDHHWTLLGAYYVYEALLPQLLQSNAQSNALPYKTQTVTTDFLGSTFRKLNLPIPSEPLESLVSEHQFRVIHDQTTVRESLYDNSALTSKDPYTYYLEGNHAISVITNQSITDSSSVLIVKDSFANSFSTLLSNHFQETHLLDLRYYNGSLAKYIEENEFQNIIFLYNNINFMQDKNLGKLIR